MGILLDLGSALFRGEYRVNAKDISPFTIPFYPEPNHPNLSLKGQPIVGDPVAKT